MQTTLTASLPDTCTIRRVTRTVGVMGGPSDAWANLATGVACRISPLGVGTSSPDEKAVLDRIEAREGWTITLPASQDVTPKDKILSGTRTFEIAGVLAARSWELCRRVVCVEII